MPANRSQSVSSVESKTTARPSPGRCFLAPRAPSAPDAPANPAAAGPPDADRSVRFRLAGPLRARRGFAAVVVDSLTPTTRTSESDSVRVGSRACRVLRIRRARGCAGGSKGGLGGPPSRGSTGGPRPAAGEPASSSRRCGRREDCGCDDADGGRDARQPAATTSLSMPPADPDPPEARSGG